MRQTRSCSVHCLPQFCSEFFLKFASIPVFNFVESGVLFQSFTKPDPYQHYSVNIMIGLIPNTGSLTGRQIFPVHLKIKYLNPLPFPAEDFYRFMQNIHTQKFVKSNL